MTPSYQPERRRFLRDVGSGMLVAGLGSHVASELGLGLVQADEVGESALTFGDWEPLVQSLEDASLDKLLPLAVEKLKSGTTLKHLIGAAALANARACGGEDFDAYHAMMALMPALEMANELPADRKALPVLKVLHRNARFVKKFSSSNPPKLNVVSVNEKPAANVDVQLQRAIQGGDLDLAEQIFQQCRSLPLNPAYNSLLRAIENHGNVHRIVLTHRSWSMKALVGEELSATLLRQSVRFSALEEERRIRRGDGSYPTSRLVPQLFDQFGLLSKPIGQRRGDDAWLEALAKSIRESNQAGAAEIVAAAVSEGFSLEDVGEAISLAANARVLRDPGRRKALPGKPVGSVHGGSEGIHACDATNAWRNVSRVSNRRNAIASLIVAGYYVGDDSFYQPADGPMAGQPLPLEEHLDELRTQGAKQLLSELNEAITAGDQIRASALAHRYGEMRHPVRPVLDLLLDCAIRSDGALHAEKFYRTVTEEYNSTRPAFRWRHIVALARVSASQNAFESSGYRAASELLKVS